MSESKSSLMSFQDKLQVIKTMTQILLFVLHSGSPLQLCHCVFSVYLLKLAIVNLILSDVHIYLSMQVLVWNTLGLLLWGSLGYSEDRSQIQILGWGTFHVCLAPLVHRCPLSELFSCAVSPSLMGRPLAGSELRGAFISDPQVSAPLSELPKQSHSTLCWVHQCSADTLTHTGAHTGEMHTHRCTLQKMTVMKYNFKDCCLLKWFQQMTNHLWVRSYGVIFYLFL